MPNHAKAIEAAARAMKSAECPGREGPYGGYDYGHNPEFYGPAPEGGRHVIRDFRYPHSKGEWVHQTDDAALHEAMYEKLTAEHIATAAITAFLRTVEASPAMIEAGTVALSHQGVDYLEQTDAPAAFKAMSKTLANEVEQADG